MIVGIPRALLYYKYEVLWKAFFNELGITVIISDETNKEIMNNGIKYSVDENCLASKVFMGHVYSLIGRCDYIFVPRFCSFKNKDVVCVKFNALYDICVNTFENAKFITYDIDYKKNQNEFMGFLKLGKMLNKSKYATIKAYLKAKKEYDKKSISNYKKQNNEILSINKEKLKILIVTHPYISHDKYIGTPIVIYLEELGTYNIYADIYDDTNIARDFEYFTKTVYWKYNKESLNNLKKYMPTVDGIIFMSVFPCGADALVNDICIRKILNIPTINLVIDDLDSDTGIKTRLESFVDIITERKKAQV